MIALACVRTGDREYFSCCFSSTTRLHYVSFDLITSLVVINSKGLDSWLSANNTVTKRNKVKCQLDATR